MLKFFMIKLCNYIVNKYYLSISYNRLNEVYVLLRVFFALKNILQRGKMHVLWQFVYLYPCCQGKQPNIVVKYWYYMAQYSLMNERYTCS